MSDEDRAPIEAAGGRYIDIAVMGGFFKQGIKAPMLVAGEDVEPVVAWMNANGFDGQGAGAASPGSASSVKMLRSVLIKGVEALGVEAYVAAERQGILEEVMGCMGDVDQLGFANFVGTLVQTHIVHAHRRWEEMGLVAQTLRETGVEPLMTEVIETQPPPHGRRCASRRPTARCRAWKRRWRSCRRRSSVADDVFDRLVALLGDAKAKFRVIEHEAEGRSEAISVIRGNRPDQAAKAMVLDLRGGGGGRRHVLAILPGSRKLDFGAVAQLFEARKCGFASPDTAQELTGCVMGSVPPFSLNPALAIVVDEDLLANDTLFFNAGRLDRSMELDTKDWLAVAKPRVAKIAAKA